MELNFIKNEATRYWECEFEATADFNLHIEGVPEGKVWIYQRTTASGEHAYIKGATPYPSLVDVYDFDFSALIYPKFVKVVCGTEPTYAEVVSNGEITELKYQEKSVEVTANGNTEVIPDAGFMGLTKVNVSVNVPQSGGGEGGGSEELMYYRFVSPSLNYEDPVDVLMGYIMQACSFTSFVDDKGRRMEFPGIYQVAIGDSEGPALNSVDALVNLRYKERIVAVSCAKNFKFTMISTESPKMVWDITNGVIGLVETFSNENGFDEELRNAFIARATSIYTPITKEEYEALITNA